MNRKSKVNASIAEKATKPAHLASEGILSFESGESVVPIIPGVALKGTLRDAVRERLARLPSRHWKQNLEKNLIEEGFTPARAKELVELAAS